MPEFPIVLLLLLLCVSSEYLIKWFSNNQAQLCRAGATRQDSEQGPDTRRDQSGGTHLVVPTTLARAAQKRKEGKTRPALPPPAAALFACSSISWPNWVMCALSRSGWLAFSLALSLTHSVLLCARLIFQITHHQSS